jgi:hypothetical protein
LVGLQHPDECLWAEALAAQQLLETVPRERQAAGEEAAAGNGGARAAPPQPLGAAPGSAGSSPEASPLAAAAAPAADGARGDAPAYEGEGYSSNSGDERAEERLRRGWGPAASAADPAIVGKRIAIAIAGRQGRVQFARFCSIEGATLATEAKPQLLLDAEAIAGLMHADVAFADGAALQRLAQTSAHAVRAIPAVSATALLDPRMPLYAASLHELAPLYLTGSYVGG